MAFLLKQTRSGFAVFICVLGVFGTCRAAMAQEGIVVRDFRVSPEFYPAPNERQMKFLLEGATARAIATGRYLVTDAKLQNFSQEGHLEMVVEAPECFYSEKSRLIDSPGRLRVQTGNSGFMIEGTGFLWRQVDSTLLISNQVHTIIKPDLLSSNSNARANSTGPIEIRSENFEYSTNAGLALYRGNVRVAGTNLGLVGEQLSVELPLRERQVKTITAERDVTIDYGGITARGEKAVYSVDNDVMLLSGNSSWRAQKREGGADTITIERTNRIFRAEGNAYLRMLGESAVSGFLGMQTPAEVSGASPAERSVEIRSRTYEVRTNLAIFNDRVLLTQAEGEKNRGEMSCDKMQLAFVGTNQLQSMLAEGHVIIRETTNRFTASRAFYRVAEQNLTLTEQPAWEAGARQGGGTVIQVNTAQNRLSVSGEAWMRLPAGDLGGTRLLLSQKDHAVAEKPASTNQFAEITSRQYELSGSNVIFSGDVRITHPQMNWQCDKISIALSGKGGTAERILAEPKVTFDALNEKGQKISGAGDSAVYTRKVVGGVTNEIVELTGRPASLQATNGLTIKNSVLVLDLATGKFVVPPGKYRILGPTNSVDTNAFKVPDVKFLQLQRSRSK
jgi:lipopolysaccharide export system protein LptA